MCYSTTKRSPVDGCRCHECSQARKPVYYRGKLIEDVKPPMTASEVLARMEERLPSSVVTADKATHEKVLDQLALHEKYRHELTSAERKTMPLATGCMDYFPDALLYVSHVSYVSNEKHNPGEPLHWSKDKSNDHADCEARHSLDRGQVDKDDKLLAAGKKAWRALADLQMEIEEHQRRAHQVTAASIPIFHCKYCSFVCGSAKALSSHVRFRCTHGRS